MLYSETIAVCSEIHTKHIGVNTLCGQNVEFLHVKLYYVYLKIQSVPRSKHSISRLQKPVS